MRWEQCAAPAQFTLSHTIQLAFEKGGTHLTSPGHAFGIDSAQAFGVLCAPDDQFGVKVFVLKLIELADMSELLIVSFPVVNFLQPFNDNTRCYMRTCTHGFAIDFSYQWLGKGCANQMKLVARLEGQGVMHKDLCQFLVTWVGHKITPSSVIAVWEILYNVG